MMGTVQPLDLAGLELTRGDHRVLGAVEHAQQLLAAFGGDTSGWAWTEEVIEQDPQGLGGTPCACGHVGLRWLFPWEHPKHPGKRVITGSVCVENVEGLSPTSVAALQARAARLIAERQADKRKQEAARRVAAVTELRAQVLAAINTCFPCAPPYFAAIEAGRAASWKIPYPRFEDQSPEEQRAIRGHQSLTWAVAQAGKLKSASGQRKRLDAIRDHILREHPHTASHFETTEAAPSA